MSNVIATAQPESVPSAPEPIVENDNSKTTTVNTPGDMPLEVYDRENKTDYIIDALEIGEEVQNLPYELTKNLETISDFVKDRMKKDGYEPTTKGYKAMLSKMKSELGIDDNTSIESTVERMEAYIDSLSVLQELKKIDDQALVKQLRKARSKSEMTKIIMDAVEKIGI